MWYHKTMNETQLPSGLFWDNVADACHSVRLICDWLGMPLEPSFEVDGVKYLLKDIMCACLMVESGFNVNAVHFNKGLDNKILSTDYGLCQINSYWHIGPGKDFPSAAYVLANPAECVVWMGKLFIGNQMNLWSSYVSGAFKRYLPFKGPNQI